MKLKFKLRLPESRVTAEAECELSAASWRKRMAALAEQAGEAAPEEFPREMATHPSRIDLALVDDLINRL